MQELYKTVVNTLLTMLFARYTFHVCKQILGNKLCVVGALKDTGSSMHGLESIEILFLLTTGFTKKLMFNHHLSVILYNRFQ